MRLPGKHFVHDETQRYGDEHQSSRNLRARHERPNVKLIHRCLECLSKIKANIKNTIPSNADFVKTNTFPCVRGRENAGVMRIDPNHPAERLPQMPERTLCQERLSLTVISNLSTQYSTVVTL